MPKATHKVPKKSHPRR